MDTTVYPVINLPDGETGGFFIKMHRFDDNFYTIELQPEDFTKGYYYKNARMLNNFLGWKKCILS